MRKGSINLSGRVCIIGAGASGMAVVKALSDRGVPFDCFERSDRVGGNWVFRNPNGTSSIYRSLHANTSRERMGYAAFPMPADYPDFPHHAQVARYLEGYAEHFGLTERITFNTTVVHAKRGADGWAITLDTGETCQYGMLIVANGHLWDPRWPEPSIPGRFEGEILHAHDYIDPCEPYHLRGKRIVVVGIGNSAMDIAGELSRPGVAERLYLSARRGAWILPKYVFGRPVDQLNVTHPLAPWRVQSLLSHLLLRLVTKGPPWGYGLPRPDHPILAAHPTISQDFLDYVRRGEIVPKPAISEFQGRMVQFADGSAVEADAIVYCTGYRVSFPFFDPAFLSAPGNDLPLWRRMARPGEEDLFFIGLAQPLGAIMPLVEAQAELIGDYLVGRYALPDPETMQAEMDRERRNLRRRYVHTARHTIEVDLDRYLYDLRRERSAGERRAERGHRS